MPENNTKVARENFNKAKFFDFKDESALQEFSLKERFGDVPTTIMEFDKDPELMRLIEYDDFDEDVKKVKRRASEDPNKTQFTMKFSTYNPTEAKFIVDYYTEPDYHILDPFMGRYTRPIISLYMGRRYTGFDTCGKTVEGNREALQQKFPDMNEGSDWTLHHGSGTDLHPYGGQENVFDAVFSCPPYYDIEKYSGEGKDLSHMDDDRFDEEIQKMFYNLRPLIKTSDYDEERFHPVIFKVGSQRKRDKGLVNDMQYKFKKMAFEADFVLHDIIYSRNRTPLKFFDANKSYKKRKVVKDFETILVFLKYE